MSDRKNSVRQVQPEFCVPCESRGEKQKLALIPRAAGSGPWLLCPKCKVQTPPG